MKAKQPSPKQRRCALAVEPLNLTPMQNALGPAVAPAARVKIDQSRHRIGELAFIADCREPGTCTIDKLASVATNIQPEPVTERSPPIVHAAG
jgi:hypothetical protein